MRNIVYASLLVLMITVAGCGGTPQGEFSRADADAIRKNLTDFVAAFTASRSTA